MGTAGSVQKPLKTKKTVEKTINTERKLQSLDTKHYDKDNLHLLHDMFLGLDPTMRIYLEEKRGVVKVSTHYNRRKEVLKVVIHQVSGIIPSNIRADVCDPYFKVYLTSNEEDIDVDCSVFTTRVAEQTRLAIYDELFQFQLRSSGLENIRLVIELWDFSALIEPGELLGSVNLPTSQLIGKGATQNYIIRPPINLQAGGDVEFCVHYDVEESTLRLTGLRAEKLRIADNYCIMCRILLTRKNKFYETVENPVFDNICCWDDEYCFKVPKDDLERRSFLITVFSVDGKGKRQSLGQAIAPLMGMELDKDVIIRRSLSDLTLHYKKNREDLSYAHVLHELRDAYIAHTVAKAPQAIFGGSLLNENKKVRLSCRKAGCSSKRLLYNGKMR